jgi:hypothetical protein
MNVCQILREKPSARILKYVEVDDSQMMIRLEDCDISDKNVKALMYSFYSMSNHIYGLSLSYNQYFKDDCLRQLLDTLPSLPSLRTLSLAKLSCSDQSLQSLLTALPAALPHLRSLDLSFNPLSFFTVQRLTSYTCDQRCRLLTLRLAGTKAPEEAVIELVRGVIRVGRVRAIDLSQNVGLGYRLSAAVIEGLRENGRGALRAIDLRYTSASLLHIQEIERILSGAKPGKNIGYHKGRNRSGCYK